MRATAEAPRERQTYNAGLLTSTLPNQREIQRVSDRVFRACRPDAGEILYWGRVAGTTRFADSAISQNVVESDAQLTIKVMRGRRVGRVTINQTDDGSLRRAVADARAIAATRKPDPRVLPLPAPQVYAPMAGADAATAGQSPDARAEQVRVACRALGRRRLRGAGTYDARVQVMAVANSRGLLAFHRGSEAAMAVTATSGDASGWAATTSTRVGAVEPRAIATQAAAKAVGSRGARPFRPAAVTVVLEPAAVAELLLFLGYLGFGALAHVEGTSPLQGRLGTAIASPLLAIDDDPFHPLSLGLPFDYEGMPRRRLTLVEDGKLVGIAHDRLTARAMGVASTGHSLPQPNTEGPLPMNLVVRPGTTSLAEMIGATRRGILVTQLHYTNVLDPRRLVLTGMTRNGTYLIERGEVTRPLMNLRFTEELPSALGRITAVGDELATVGTLFGGTHVVPALRIDGFHFSSATEF